MNEPSVTVNDVLELQASVTNLQGMFNELQFPSPEARENFWIATARFEMITNRLLRTKIVIHQRQD